MPQCSLTVDSGAVLKVTPISSEQSDAFRELTPRARAQGAVSCGMQRSVKLDRLERRLAALLADLRPVPPSISAARPSALPAAAVGHAAARRRVLERLGRIVCVPASPRPLCRGPAHKQPLVEPAPGPPRRPSFQPPRPESAPDPAAASALTPACVPARAGTCGGS